MKGTNIEVGRKDLLLRHEEIQKQIRDQLTSYRIAEPNIDESMVAFEALCYNLVEQGDGDDAPVTITARRRMGRVFIRLEYEGRIYRNSDELTPENRILEAYDDNIDYSYHSGYNKITITTKRSRGRLHYYCIALLMAVAIYALIDSHMGADGKQSLLNTWIFPLETLYSNAVLMIAAPVTFLTMMRNLTNSFILAGRDSKARKLHFEIFVSSAYSIVLALLPVLVVLLYFGSSVLGDSLLQNEHLRIRITIAQFISELLPSNVFEPFITASPFPLILLSIIITLALCATGKYFNEVQRVIDVGYSLFAKILYVIIYCLPFFVIIAALDEMLRWGYEAMWYLLALFAIALLSFLVPTAVYTIQLLVRRVPVRFFFRKLIPLLIDNYRIGTAIDAIPYNIRYCSRNFGIDRRKLEDTIPILAHINLNGNCFYIYLVMLMLMELSNTDLIFSDILIVALMVYFLSFGAPNQPGSIVIAMVIMLSYMHSEYLFSVPILCEAFLGDLLNLTNVFGDIVLVTRINRVRDPNHKDGGVNLH